MRYLLGMCALMCVSWWLSLPGDAMSQGFLFWRNQGVQLSGVLAIVLLSALLWLASRPRWLEQHLGGLDHLYQLHKWSGISCGLVVTLHWVLTKAPRWLIDLGWLQATGRRPHGANPWAGLSRDLGEWAFYGMLLLIVISLIRALPYGRFRLIHKLGAVLALMAQVHSLYLLAPELRWTLFGWLAQALILLGFIATLYSLSGQIGRRQRFAGEVVTLTRHDNGTLSLTVRVDARFSRLYRPGQFALLTLHPAEGAHPFTIVHYDAARGQLQFAIKPLGDYTRSLAQRLSVGMACQVEGPYGAFTLPQASEGEQYWIAGGIGITPFIAWLEALAQRGEQRPQTRLIYCVERQQDRLFEPRLRALSQRTGVQLQIMQRDQDGLLDASQLFSRHPAACWFCGPQGMRAMLARWLPRSLLHFEHFEFR